MQLKFTNWQLQIHKNISTTNEYVSIIFVAYIYLDNAHNTITVKRISRERKIRRSSVM